MFDEVYIKKLEQEHAAVFAKNQELECYAKTQGNHISRLNEVLERSIILNKKALKYNWNFFNTPCPTTTQVEDERCTQQFEKLLEHLYDSSKTINAAGNFKDWDIFDNFMKKIVKEFWK